MEPRRLENEDEEKFWEAWIKDELTFCYRFGKLGSAGGTKLKRFKTAAEAQAELEEKLAQKLAEGFVELGKEPPEDDDAEDDAESDGEEQDDDSDDEEEDDDEESDAAPESVPPPPPPPPKPTLPARLRARARPPSQGEIDAAVAALSAVTTSIGGRSWRVSQKARAARRALERLGGADPRATPALASAFDAVMASVIAPKKRLSLAAAVSLLWTTDAKVAAKTVAGWKAKVLASPAETAIGVLAETFAAVPDPEVALHTGAALVERSLPLAGWKARFSRVAPFLEESLATKGSSVEQFLKSLHGDGDPLVKKRIASAATVEPSLGPARRGPAGEQGGKR